jgi:hypothetical protein
MPHFAEMDTLKRGELDDQANPTFPQEHGVDKYRGKSYKRYDLYGFRSNTMQTKRKPDRK